MSVLEQPQIVLLDDMIQGSGDSPDILTEGLIHIKTPENLNVDPLCFRGIFDDKGNLVQDNRTIIDFEVAPGFFYIGDKEYFLFSQKVTDVVRLGEDQKLKLKEYPNGYSHIGLYGPFSEEDFGGFYRDTLITDEQPIFSKYLNETSPLYRYSESGYNLCYDTSGFYPLGIPPEIPLGQCFTYWEPARQTNPLDPTTYSHDIMRNEIELLVAPIKKLSDTEHIPATDPTAQFYIAEYERTVLRTLTGSNFNPMSRITNEGFLVINPDIETKIPDRIQIVDPASRSGPRLVTVVFEAFNFQNNPIKNLLLDVALRRTFEDQVGLPIEYSIGDYNEYYTTYNILNPSPDERAVLENGVLVNRLAPLQDSLILKTEGLISGSHVGPFAYNAPCLINEDGIGIIYFLIPMIQAKEQELELDFSFKTIELKSIKIRNYNFVDGNSILFSSTEKFSSSVAVVRTASNGQQYVLLEMVSTTLDLTLYAMSDFVSSQLTGRAPKPLTIDSFEIDGQFLRVNFQFRDDTGAEAFVMAKQIDISKNYVVLDSSVVYGL